MTKIGTLVAIILINARSALLLKRCVVLALVSLCSAAVCAQEPSGESIPELRQHLFQWRQAFKNLRITAERRYLNVNHVDLSKWQLSDSEIALAAVDRVDWIWSKDRMDRFEVTHLNGEPLKSKARRLEVYDGRNESYFTAEFLIDQNDKERLDQLSIKRVVENTPPVTYSWDVLPWLYERKSRQWIDDILTSSPTPQAPIRPPVASEDTNGARHWTFEGIETICDCRCAKLIRVTLAGGEPHQKTTESLWLDLEHDYLPRRAIVEFFSDAETLSNRQEYLVDEFQQIAEGVWFPRVSRQQNGTAPAWLLTITDVQLDVELNNDEFQPPAPEPTTAVDHSLGLIMTPFSDSAESSSPERSPEPNHAESNMLLKLAPVLALVAGLIAWLLFRNSR